MFFKRLKSTLSSDGGVSVSMRISIEKVRVPCRANGSRFAVRWTKGKHKGVTSIGVLNHSGVGIIMEDLEFNTTMIEGKKKVLGFRLLEAIRHTSASGSSADERLVPVLDLTFDLSDFYFKNFCDKDVGCKEVTLGSDFSLTLSISLISAAFTKPKLSPAIRCSPMSDAQLDFSSKGLFLDVGSTFNSNAMSSTWKSLITGLYRKHGVGYDSEEIDAFLESYKGAEGELYEKLQVKYEPGSLTDDQRQLYANPVDDIPALSRQLYTKESVMYGSSTDPMSSDGVALRVRRMDTAIRQSFPGSSESEPLSPEFSYKTTRPRKRSMKNRSVSAERKLAPPPPPAYPPPPDSPARIEAKWGETYHPAVLLKTTGEWVDVMWKNGEVSCVKVSDTRRVKVQEVQAPRSPRNDKVAIVSEVVAHEEGVVLCGKPKPQPMTLMHHEVSEADDEDEEVEGGPLEGIETASSGHCVVKADCFTLPSRSVSGSSSGGASKSSASFSTLTAPPNVTFSARTRWGDFKAAQLDPSPSPSPIPTFFNRPHWSSLDAQPENTEPVTLGASREQWRRM